MATAQQPKIPLKRLSVKFFGSGDELSQIVSADDLTEKKRKKSVQQYLSTDEGAEPEDGDEEKEEDPEDYEEEESVTTSSKALIGDDDVDGGKVYSFRTPKRSTRASQLAAQSVQKMKDREAGAQIAKRVSQSAPRPTRPKANMKRRSSKGGDVSKIKSVNLDNENGGDKDINCNSITTGIVSSTPSNRRRSARLAVATVRSRYQAKGSSSDSPESSSGGDDEDYDDSESVTSEASSVHSGPVEMPKTKARRKVPIATDKEMEEASEGYFMAHSGGVVTSDHTLARLAKPKMDKGEVDGILKTATNSNNEERNLLFEEHVALFQKWMVQLSNGFNLLLYGLGSKRHLVESFRSCHLLHFPHIVTNGFFPSLTIRQILSAIVDDVLESKRSARGLQEQLDVIKSELENRSEPLFLIFHNIDGPTLRATKNQVILSSLAQISCVHIIATIDHINAPLIWDQGRFGCFNWLWYDITTYQDYTEETSYENSLLVRQSGALTLSSINHVMKSVPPNVQGVFNILVEAQLEHKDDISYAGMTFQDLYQRCREAFYVSSDLTLRAQLTEFKDHKLLTLKKGIDGAELLSIPVESSTLQEFKQQEDF